MRKTLPILAIFTLLIIFIGSCGKPPEPNPQDRTKPKKISTQLFDTLNSNVRRLSLNAIDFLTVAHGIIVGDSGLMLKTTNGGYNWERIGTGLTHQKLYGISIIDTFSIVAVGNNGSISQSDDGGITWISVPGITETLRDVEFNSNNFGYAVGDFGVIYLSSDKGHTWAKMHSDSSQTLNGIAFNSLNNPYVVGNNGIMLSSTNNGATWVADTIPTLKNLNSIHFTQTGFHTYAEIGFAVGDDGTIIKTTDDGATWSAEDSHTTKNLYGVFISFPHWGHAVGDDGTVVRYNGTNWELLPQPTDKRLNAVDPVVWNPTSICVGEDGRIMLINPPPVNDGSTVSVSGDLSCVWSFILTTEDLKGTYKGGISVDYLSFEVCSSMEISFFGSTPSTGWAQNDRFFANSVPLNQFTTYPNTEQPLDPLTLLRDPGGDPTAGYLTCFFMGADGNPYLLSSYEIECSP